MRHALFIALSILGFVIIDLKTNPLTVNGHPFGNTVTISGNLYISVDDLAKAINGGGGTLEQAGLRIQGNRLTTFVPAVQSSMVSPRDLATGQASGKRQHKPITIVKEWGAASALIIHGGKAYLPLTELAKAFGGTLNAPANLPPGAPIALNFPQNPSAVFVFNK